MEICLPRWIAEGGFVEPSMDGKEDGEDEKPDAEQMIKR